MKNSNATVVIKLVVTSSLGCTQDEFSHTFSTIENVVPAFTQSAKEGCGPLKVNFINTSTSLTNATFKWDFGNGITTTQVMPGQITFLPDPLGKDTTYNVSLTATTSCGAVTVINSVFVKAKPLSLFSPDKTAGCSPMKVTFSNTSPGGTNTYYFDFGDGTLLTKTDKSPVEHTYITGAVKDYVVKMIAKNDCGSEETSYTIRVSPNTILPELVVNANEKEGCAPLKVNFYNNSKGASSFKYDFGDGSTLVTRTAPEVVTHTFNTSGTFIVTLTASNGCSDTTTTETIKVLPQPAVTFTADITLGCPGLAVQFKNTSSGGISYLWDFGDGTTSAEFEPKHIFNGNQEFYTVSLQATNTLGCTNTLAMIQYIHIVPPPVAQFNVLPSTLISIPDYTFRFEDESTGNPSIWSWDFGDKQSSALKNPTHTYPDTGTYVVTLKVTNQQGCFTTTFKKVTIVGVPGYLYVPNSFMPGSETPELRVFKAKGSGIKTWKMSIFNKWGQSLWETTKLEEGRPVEGWDGIFSGTPVPQDVYFWKIDVELINGTAWKGMTYDSSAPKKTGIIHLIR
ncbi:PKD domain-containing protein [Pedobacter sp. NJ-S-72]